MTKEFLAFAVKREDDGVRFGRLVGDERYGVYLLIILQTLTRRCRPWNAASNRLRKGPCLTLCAILSAFLIACLPPTPLSVTRA